MDKAIIDILTKLEDNNYKAYLVGGYVRDYLMNKKTDDIDICTNAKPKEIMSLFSDKRPISYDYGNAIITYPNFKCEITTFRKDIKYKNNRQPERIEYIDTLENDVLRRDFTINAICMDKNGNIIDILHGKDDIKKKIIRAIGEADVRIKEDSLRIMRAIRFATILNFKLDKDLKKAIINNKDLLKNLSYDRKKEELNKIFTSENKKYGVKLIKELKLEEALDLKNIDNVMRTNDLIGMWSTIAKENTYSFTKTEKALIKSINEVLDKDVTDNNVLYKYGIYPISIACDLKKLNKKKIIKLYENLPIKDRNEIKITAEEICEILNQEPSSFLKNIYDILEKMILEGNLKNDNISLKNYIKENKDML